MIKEPTLTTPRIKAEQFEVQFTAIFHERMANIPICNTRLKVAAIGFRYWSDYILGILVTPWFMNLILLTEVNDKWTDLLVGSKQSFTFDAGNFEFIVGEESNIGKYMSCSLFSPMFEFESHEAAIATADAVLVGLFDVENRESFTPQSLSNESEIDSASQASETIARTEEIGFKDRNAPLSRRELLRGRFLGTPKQSSESEISDDETVDL